MDPSAATFLLVLASTFSYPFVISAQSPTPTTTVSKISVVGVVYCDSCSTSTFSKQSYFLPGAEVHIECRFRATSPRTTEQISFSVNRTTDQHGVYKLDIPSVDGINCVDGSVIVSMCQATLIGSTSPICNIPFLRSTSTEISVKSRQENLCVYSLSGLSYKPSHKNSTLCGQNQKDSSLDSSKFSYLPKLPFSPFPSIPTLPFPPPSLPFPFPQIPSYPPTFNLGHPPTTWGNHVPSLSNASPPGFKLGNPTTWIPHVSSPSPPNIPQNQSP